MSEPVQPGQPAAKKGMSTGAKIAIGCLIGIVVVVGGCFIVTGYFVKKGVNSVKEFAEKAQNDPDGAAFDAAVFAFKMNPDAEIVSQDESTKTITVRDKKTGKEITFNLDDIKSGHLSLESDGEKVDVGVKPGENGQGGSMTVESNKGKMTFGAGSNAAVPDWIPTYPGSSSEGFSAMEVNGEKSGTFTIHTSDGVEQVMGFFEDRLKGAGFEVNKTTMTANGNMGGNLTCTAGGRTVNITLTTQNGETQGLVAYNEKQ
jgi:hypothetical protein